MPTDQLVTAAHVLRAMSELDRRGSTKVLSELEKLEPDLIEHVLESLTQLYHRLLNLGLPGKDARRIHRRAENITLVCILALRQAYRELLDDQAGGAEPEPDDEPGSNPQP